MRLGRASMMSVSIPTRPGTPFGGGYYVGRMLGLDGFRYALIVAPKSGGETTGPIQLLTNANDVPGARSGWDGASNTAAFAAVTIGTSPAAIALASLNGSNFNGFNDWHIPARYQLEMCYRNLKPSVDQNITKDGTTSNQYADPPTPAYTATDPAQTTVAAFQKGGPEAFEDGDYWSSTSFAPNMAWYQYMAYSAMTYELTTRSRRIRVVRMIRI